MSDFGNLPGTFVYGGPAALVSDHDGDTCTVRLDRGWNDSSIKVVRLYGIDTPELHPQAAGRTAASLDAERTAAKAAADFANAWLQRGPFLLQSNGVEGGGEFGRTLGTLVRDGQSLGDLLVAQGFAVPFFDRPGDKKWHEVHG